MGRRAKVTGQDKGPSLEQLREQAVKDLEQYGLTPDDTIRFRRTEGGTWTTASVKGVNKDGSLSLFARGFRAIPPENCEVRRKGPRGGVTWEPLNDV